MSKISNFLIEKEIHSRFGYLDKGQRYNVDFRDFKKEAIQSGYSFISTEHKEVLRSYFR